MWAGGGSAAAGQGPKRTPPPPLCRPKFQPPQSEGAGRGLVPLGDQETGEQTFCCPHPPQQKWGRTESRPSTPPPPRMPSHPHCRPSHGDRGPSGSGLRATSMLGSGTRMVTQQVVLLSHTSEQVDPSTTLPPPPPACAPDGRGARSRRPQGLKVEAVKGSQLDRCGYPLSGLPREPPGVHVPLQLHHRRLGQHSPVHSSAVVGDPWRPDSHQPTPAPPPPFLNGEAIRVWCPLGPLVYAGCSAAASAASTGGTQGREAHSVPWCPSICPGYALGRGSRTQPARQHHLCLRQSRSAGLTPVVPRTTAFPCQ